MKKAPLVWLLLVLCSVGSADTLRTRSGEVLKGRLIEETKTTLRIRTPYGELIVPRSSIQRHERSTYVLRLKNGAELEGEIVGETDRGLVVRIKGKRHTLALSEVQSVTEKPAASRTPRPPKLDARKLLALHRQVLAYFKQKAYRKALAGCRKILESNPEDYIALYNAACASALLGEKAGAVEYLRKSLEAGYVQFAHMEQDTDLDAIRGEPGYRELVRHKAEYLRKSTEKTVARIARTLRQRGVDAGRYQTVFDRERNFVYLHTKPAGEFAAVRTALNAYADAQWAHLFQNRPQQPLYIVLLTPADSRKVFRGRIGGVYSPAGNVLFCGDIPACRLMRTSVVRHEFTHALHFADMVARKQRHPIWLIEGLATLFESSDCADGRVVPRQSYRLPVVQAAVRSGRSLPWKTLMKLDHPGFMRNARLAYAQSRYMLFYMYQKGLLKKFYDEYTDEAHYANDRSAMEAFEVVFGKPIESVERDWKAWVLRQRVPPVPFLGVGTRDREGTVAVTQVVPRSPAARAGLRPGDVLVAVNGAPIASTSDLLEAIGRRKVGETVAIRARRKGKELAFKARLARRRVTVRRPPRPRSAPYLGLAVERKNGGVCVKEVAKRSPAEKAGVRPGDVLLEFRGRKLATVRDYLDALKKCRPGQKVGLKLQRDGKGKTLSIRLAAQPSK